MDFLDLIFPLLILLGPAIFRSISQKNKAEKKNARKTMSNSEQRLSKKENVNNIPKYYERFEKKPKSMEERKLKPTISRKDEERHITEERHISEEEKIKELKAKRQNYADSEKQLIRNKNIRNKINEEDIISNRKRKNNIELDYIKCEEIGSQDIDLRFDKKQLVQGIILSEILSKPKALAKKK